MSIVVQIPVSNSKKTAGETVSLAALPVIGLIIVGVVLLLITGG